MRAVARIGSWLVVLLLVGAPFTAVTMIGAGGLALFAWSIEGLVAR